MTVLLAIALYALALFLFCGLVGMNRREDEVTARHLDAERSRLLERELRAQGWD